MIGLTAIGGPPGKPQTDLDSFGWRWVRAIRATSYVELSAEALHELLTASAKRLADALTAEEFDETCGSDVAEALVQARLGSPEALQRSIAVLVDLPDAVGLSASRNRMGQLLGSFAASFAATVQQRTLDEQEGIRLASLRAVADSEQARLDSEARLRAVFGAAGVAIAIGNLEGQLVEVNPALARMLGQPLASLPGRPVFEFFHPDDLPDIREQVYGTLVSGSRDVVRLEKRFLRGQGEIGWTAIAVSLVRDSDGNPAYLVAVGEDVTERHRLQQQLEHQAHHDALTGLPNRTFLHRQLTELLTTADSSDRVAVLFVDLDEFKAINDTLGHAVGDQLLVAIGERLRQYVESVDSFIARFGGDEFVVLSRHNAGGNVGDIADNLLDAISAPVHIGGHTLRVSASIGVVDQPAHGGRGPDDLLQAADATLYVAKADGRNRWALFDVQRNAQQTLRFTLAGQLRSALESEQFQVEYQPIVSLADGNLRGAEALLRWRHPQLGSVSPELFIPLAERSGIIGDLGRWVLRRACEAARDWPAPAGEPLFVSVNISMVQCTEAGLVDDVARILSETGLPPQRLQLELTETAVMKPHDAGVATLRALAATGTRIAIDDFGVGYSNLAYLRHLPVHALKLAGAFVNGTRSARMEPADEMIVSTVVNLAHGLGMQVTGEAVETVDQADHLAAIGCDLAQGWLFGLPGPAEQFSTAAGRPSTRKGPVGNRWRPRPVDDSSRHDR